MRPRQPWTDSEGYESQLPSLKGSQELNFPSYDLVARAGRPVIGDQPPQAISKPIQLSLELGEFLHQTKRLLAGQRLHPERELGEAPPHYLELVPTVHRANQRYRTHVPLGIAPGAHGQRGSFTRLPGTHADRGKDHDTRH